MLTQKAFCPLIHCSLREVESATCAVFAQCPLFVTTSPQLRRKQIHRLNEQLKWGKVNLRLGGTDGKALRAGLPRVANGRHLRAGRQCFQNDQCPASEHSPTSEDPAPRHTEAWPPPPFSLPPWTRGVFVLLL